MQIIHGDLFSGIGGFSLAARSLGWHTAFHCEINPFGQKVLTHHFPNAELYEDITTTDFTIWRGRIDVLTGGFPCQPYSAAGKRKGKDDERHLWPQMLRAIREIRPGYVVGENVRGLTNWNGGLVFDEVQADLEAEGYEVLPFLLPAAGVGAPHERYRIWFVAYSNLHGHEQRRFGQDRQAEGASESEGDKRKRFRDDVGRVIEQRFTPNTTSDRRKRAGAGVEIEKGLHPRPKSTGQLEGRSEGLRGEGAASNADGERGGGLSFKGQTPRTQSSNELSGSARGISAWDASNTTSGRGREDNGKGESGQPNQKGAKHDWQNFPTQSPVCSRNDGIPSQLDGITFSKWRNESIKAYGNAIVPQVVLQIFKVINKHLKTQTV